MSRPFSAPARAPLVVRIAMAGALACLLCLLAAPPASAEFPFPGQGRVSFMGADGDPALGGSNADVAYDSKRDRFMVAWQGKESPVEGQEIYVKVISRTHTRISVDIKISDTPGTFISETPRIVYNPQADEYLVVWAAKHTMTDAQEIYGQRLTPAGDEKGPDDFPVSSTGTGSAPFDASVPALAYNSSSRDYLAVWRSNDQAVGEYEVYGQMISPTGTALGIDDFRVSAMGPEGSALFGADTPAVAADPVSRRYLVAWSGDHTVDGEREIWTRAYDGDGVPLASGQKQVSHMGPDGVKAFDAFEPALAFDPLTREYLLAWRGDATGQDEQFEVYAQRLDAANSGVGVAGFRVSDMGPDGNPSYAVGGRPTVEYVSATHRYLVLWHGDDNTPPLVDDELEVFGQALTAGGAAVGADFRVTTFGPEGDASTDAQSPEAAYSPLANESLVVWQGNGVGSLAPAKTEIFSVLVGDDRDLDGILDPVDHCPTVARGRFDANADGCPDDRDRDGRLDQVDRCPSIAAGAFDADHDGCPDDTDGDGVLDARDACPRIKGGRLDKNGNGCPGPFGSLRRVLPSYAVLDYAPRPFIRVESLRFTHLPRAKVTIVLHCTRGCRITERRVKPVGRQRVSSSRFRGRRLRTGTIIEITITSKNLIGSVRRYVVRGGNLQKLGPPRCIPVDSHRARKTCASGR